MVDSQDMSRRTSNLLFYLENYLFSAVSEMAVPANVLQVLRSSSNFFFCCYFRIIQIVFSCIFPSCGSKLSQMEGHFRLWSFLQTIHISDFLPVTARLKGKDGNYSMFQHMFTWTQLLREVKRYSNGAYPCLSQKGGNSTVKYTHPTSAG